jgi:repressor LexA
MASELTKRQRQILDFILRTQGETGVSPSWKEIAAHFGFKSDTTVGDHLRLIRRKGFLGDSGGKARALPVALPLARFKSRVVDIPVFGSIPAGPPDSREAVAEGCVSVDVNSIGTKVTARTLALRVKGDSMEGKHIVDGDIVVLEHGGEPRNGQIVAALIDGLSTLKTFVVQGRKVFLRAENPRYPNLIPAEELMIQGVVVAVIRKMEKQPLGR